MRERERDVRKEQKLVNPMKILPKKIWKVFWFGATSEKFHGREFFRRKIMLRQDGVNFILTMIILRFSTHCYFLTKLYVIKTVRRCTLLAK